jgi:hypothetical protein
MVKDDVQLPSNKEAERFALGSILRDPNCFRDVFGVLQASDFVDEVHGAIYSAMVANWQQGGALEPAPLAASLKGNPIFERGGLSPAGELLTVADSIATAAHAKHYADEVLNTSLKRQTAEFGEAIRKGSLNGQDIRLIVSAAGTTIDNLRRRIAAKARDKFTFAQLSQQYPELHAPIVEGVARQAEVVNVVSHSKFGKSWFIYHLLLCIIKGVQWLGQFNVSPGPCLLIDNELHKPTIAYRIRKVAEAMGLKASDYQHDLEIWSYRGKLCDLRELAEELRQIKPGRYKAIVLDSKYRFATPGVNENDNNSTTLDYNICADIADYTLAALFLVLHASKGSQSDKAVTDTGVGAGSQSRACDAHIVLREHQQPGVAVLDAALRSFAPIEPQSLRWEFPLWLPANDVDPSQLKRQQSRGQHREGINKIVGVLRQGAASTRSIRTQTGFGKSRAERLLDQLFADEQVDFTETKIGGATYREYTLKT